MNTGSLPFFYYMADQVKGHYHQKEIHFLQPYKWQNNPILLQVWVLVKVLLSWCVLLVFWELMMMFDYCVFFNPLLYSNFCVWFCLCFCSGSAHSHLIFVSLCRCWRFWYLFCGFTLPGLSLVLWFRVAHSLCLSWLSARVFTTSSVCRFAATSTFCFESMNKSVLSLTNEVQPVPSVLWVPTITPNHVNSPERIGKAHSETFVKQLTDNQPICELCSQKPSPPVNTTWFHVFIVFLQRTRRIKSDANKLDTCVEHFFYYHLPLKTEEW